MHQRAVTIGMWNSYSGYLLRVKTLLEMGLVSIHDKDGVRSLAISSSCAQTALTVSAHFNLTRQDGRTMLDYAIIAKSKENNWNQLDETIAFLQSCSCQSKFTLHLIFNFMCFQLLDPRHWTPSNHALWSLPAKERIHLALALLWTLRKQGRQMALPHELVEIILEHAV
jgi:hypothetical protein